MPKPFLRLIAISLLPGLLIAPGQAASFSELDHLPTFPISQIHRFEQEALAAVVLAGNQNKLGNQVPFIQVVSPNAPPKSPLWPRLNAYRPATSEEQAFLGELESQEHQLIESIVIDQMHIPQRLIKNFLMIEKAQNKKDLANHLEDQIREEMMVSLERLGLNKKTREESIRSGITQFSNDLQFMMDEVKGGGAAALEQRKSIARFGMALFHFLLLQDELDFKYLPYVTHSLKHSLNVREELGKTLAISSVVRDSLARKYGGKGPALAYMSAWLHDIGYSVLTPAMKLVNVIAAQKGLTEYQAGKGYHTRLGILIAQMPIAPDGLNLLDLMDKAFAWDGIPLSEMHGSLGEGSALEDIRRMILLHGSDRKSSEEGLPGTGRHAYTPVSTEDDILNFCVRQADNADIDMRERSYSHHANPFFIALLRRLFESAEPHLSEPGSVGNETLLNNIKKEFLVRGGAYKKAYVLYLQAARQAEGQHLDESVIQQMADEDFDFIQRNIDGFDASNFPHFGGMVYRHEIREMTDTTGNPYLEIRVILNKKNTLIPPEMLRYQAKRTRDSYHSLQYGPGATPIQVVEVQKDVPVPTSSTESTLELLELQKAIQKLPEGSSDRRILEIVWKFAQRPENMHLLHFKTTEEDTTLISRDRSTHVYILLEGNAERVKNRQAIKRFDHPTLIGETSLITGNPAYTTRVTGTAKVLEMDSKMFKAMLRDPELVVQYADLVIQRQEEAISSAYPAVAAELRKPFVNVSDALEELHLPEPIASLMVDFRLNPDEIMRAVDPLLSEIAPLWRRLMKVPRGGDVDRGASNEEAWSVADHEALEIFMALAQAKLDGWDNGRIVKTLRLILIHDMPEIAPPYDMTPKKNPILWKLRPLKHAWESLVMQILFLFLPKETRSLWRASYQSVHDETDPLAVWAERTDKQVGVVQLLAQAWRFRNHPNIDVHNFLEPSSMATNHQWEDADKRGLLTADPYDRFNITRINLVQALAIVGSAVRLSKVVGLGEKSVVYMTSSEQGPQAIEIVGGKGVHTPQYKMKMLAQKAAKILSLQDTHYVPRLDGIYRSGTYLPVTETMAFNLQAAELWVGKKVDAIRRELIEGKKLGAALKHGDITPQSLDAHLSAMQAQFIQHGFLLMDYKPEDFRITSDGKPVLIYFQAVRPLSTIRNKKRAKETAEQRQKILIDQIPELIKETKNGGNFPAVPAQKHLHNPARGAA